MEPFVTLVGSLGFPIVVALYLLTRMERVITEMTHAVSELTYALTRLLEQKDR